MGYEDGIPDEAPYELEAARKAPSWRRVCKALLRNDFWCKGLTFSQTKSAAYGKYLDLMRRRKEKWGIQRAFDLFQKSLLLNRSDGPSREFIRRCKFFIEKLPFSTQNLALDYLALPFLLPFSGERIFFPS